MNFFDKHALGIGDKTYSFYNVKSFDIKDKASDFYDWGNDMYTVKVCEERLDNCTELYSINEWNKNDYPVTIGYTTKTIQVPNNITKKEWEWQYENLKGYYKLYFTPYDREIDHFISQFQ